jgi:hypothetical protein
VTVDTPHGEDYLAVLEGSIPGECVLIVSVDKRPVDIQDRYAHDTQRA